MTVVDTFSPTFEEPFSDSSAISNQDAPFSFPISLNNHPYMVDLKGYSRTTLTARREAISQASQPGEESLDTQGLWNRQQWDWRFGAGQNLWDADGSSDKRILDSTGLDPWTAHEISLLHSTILDKTASNTNLQCFTINGILYLVDGSNIYYSNDYSDFPPIWQTPAAIGSTITGVTNDGNFIFAATGSAIKKVTLASSTVAGFGSFAADHVFYAAGRLLASKANNIVELDNTGTIVSGSLNYLHFNAGFIWDDIMPTPSGIYVFGHANDTSEIYFIDVDTSNGSLKPPSYAGGVNPGETIYSLSYTEGVVGYGTSKGFRVAQLDSGSFGLTHGPLIEFQGGIRGIAQSNQFLYAGLAGIQYGGLVRFDLSTFTDSLVPAYAMDIDSGAVGGVLDVCVMTSESLIDYPFFCVAGEGIYGFDEGQVATGQFNTGAITYGVFIKKIPTTIDFRCEPLEADTSISIFATPDFGDEVAIATLGVEGATGPSEPIQIDVSPAEEINLRFQFNQNGVGEQIKLKRWTLSAIPTPLRTDEIIIPIIMKERVGNLDEQQYAYDTFAEWIYLKRLEASGEIVTYQEGDQQWRVIVDTVAMGGDESADLSWTDDTSFLEGEIKVRLLTINAVS